MNAFNQASTIEDKGIALVMPYLIEKAFDGRVVHLGSHNDKSTLIDMQRSGDFVLNTSENKFITVELKVESRHTGNLYIETWSNKNRLNQGWLYKCKSDRLIYLFLDRPAEAYSVNVRKMQNWLFQTINGKQRLWSFPEREQGKYKQLNDTWGVLVPVLRFFDAGIATKIQLSSAEKEHAA